MRTIGMLEFTSICRGIEAADVMIKAGAVDLVTAKTACPGKYVIIVTGDVGAVNSAIEAGEEVGKHYIVNRLILANAHPQTIKSIQGVNDVKFFDALGVMEFYSLTSAVEAADAAVKSGLIQLIEIRLGMAIGGKAFVTLTGDVGSVKAAIDAGKRASVKEGLLLESVVIPSPSKELYYQLL